MNGGVEHTKSYDFIEWVKYIRKNIFTCSQQQFGGLLEEGLSGKIGDRYIGVLEGHASTIRIDVLEFILKMIGVDFQSQVKFYDMAFNVVRSAIRESDKFHIVHFLKMRYDIGTDNEPKFISRLDEKTKCYIYNLVNLNNTYYGGNRLVDMQSINYFWTVVAIEYYIMCQGSSSLSEATSSIIQYELKDVLNPVVDLCEKIFEKTAIEGISEGKNKFRQLKEQISNISITFQTPKSKKEQLEYKVNLRTQRITKCVNIVLLDYLNGMVQLLDKISASKLNSIFTYISSWSNNVSDLADSLSKLIQTGDTDDKDMYMGYKLAINNNHIELIYDMSKRINEFEKGNRALHYLEYMLPEYDDMLIDYLCKNNSLNPDYIKWHDELKIILSDIDWKDKYAGAYAKLKYGIVDYLYLNSVQI